MVRSWFQAVAELAAPNLGRKVVGNVHRCRAVLPQSRGRLVNANFGMRRVVGNMRGHRVVAVGHIKYCIGLFR